MAAEMNEDGRSMDDLEEGECSDSDDGDILDLNDKKPSFPTERLGMGHSNVYAGTRIPQIVINSDESGDDRLSNDEDVDSDDCPSSEKRYRGKFHKSSSSFSRAEHDSQVPFVNPLRFRQPESSFASTDTFVGMGKKKRNNVWGSVMTEQILSHDIKQFGVKKSVPQDGYRGIESYDYTIAQDDDRPAMESDPELSTKEDHIFDEIVDLEKEVRNHENRKRKRSAKERLGRRSYNKHKARSLVVPEGNDVSEVVHAITDALGETNVELFTQIVEAIGKDQAVKLYYMTEDVENAGGMLINNGDRRRTPGGVYIQLLKSESMVSQEVISSIFDSEEEKWKLKRKEERKIRKAARRRQARARESAMKREMDLDRPVTPTPSDELDFDVLDPLENMRDNEGEIVDFPERPATPEPKDDSSDGDEDEDEEDEDISVVIAKAKAAIFRRQREMEEGEGPEEQKSGESLDVESQNVDMGSATEASSSHVSSVLSLTEDIDNNDMT